jgi:sec-independent protein translocase protein TatA
MVAVDLEWGLPVVLILVLILFGGAKIPQLMRNLGSAQREFKKGLEEGSTDEAKKSEKSKSD